MNLSRPKTRLPFIVITSETLALFCYDEFLEIMINKLNLERFRFNYSREGEKLIKQGEKNLWQMRRIKKATELRESFLKC